jgi:hypothetical protein
MTELTHEILIGLGFETSEKQNHSYYQMKCYKDYFHRWHCLGIYKHLLDGGRFSIDTFFKTQPITTRTDLERLISFLKPPACTNDKISDVQELSEAPETQADISQAGHSDNRSD